MAAEIAQPVGSFAVKRRNREVRRGFADFDLLRFFWSHVYDDKDSAQKEQS
jgi:hypothetical protein